MSSPTSPARLKEFSDRCYGMLRRPSAAVMNMQRAHDDASPVVSTRTRSGSYCVLESESDFAEASALCNSQNIRVDDVQWWTLSESAYACVEAAGLPAIDAGEVVNLDDIKTQAFRKSQEFIERFCDSAGVEDLPYRRASALCMNYFMSQVYTYVAVADSIVERQKAGRLLTLKPHYTIGSLRLGKGTGVDGTFRTILEATAGKHTHWNPARRLARLKAMRVIALRQISDFRRLLISRRRVTRMFLPDGMRSTVHRHFDIVIDDGAGDFTRNFDFRELIKHPRLSSLGIAYYVDPTHCAGLTPANSSQALLSAVFESFPSASDCIRLFAAQIPKNWRAWCEIWDNSSPPHLRALLGSQFYQLIYLCFVDAFRGRQRAKAICAEHTPKVFVSSDHDAPFHRMVTLQARQTGAHTVSFTHAGGYLYQSPPDTYVADTVLVNGRGMENFARNLKVGSAQLRTTGNSSLRALGSAKGASGQPSQVRILVVLQGIVNWADPYSPALMRRTIADLCDQFALHRDWQVLIKSHPINKYHGFVKQAAARAGQHVSCTDQRWSRERFAEWDVAIFPGGMSVTLLELAALGIPAVFIDSAISKTEREIYRPDFAGAGVSVNSAKEAVETAAQIVTDPDFKLKVLCDSRSYLERFAASVDGAAVLAETLGGILGVELPTG